MKSIFNLAALGALALLSSTSWAYNEVMDTGEVLAPGHFKLTGDLQAMTEEGGANVTGMFDAGIQKDFSVRALVGFGKTDYYGGGLVKWVPIPDVDNQPAIGLNAGLTYAKWNDARDLTFLVQPLVSKKFLIDTAAVTPYLSLPIGVRIRNSDVVKDSSQTTWQIAGGAQLQVEKWKNLQFIAEVGLDLDHTFSYVSAGAIFYFDNEKGFVWE